MSVAVDEVSRQAEPFKDAGLKGSIFVKIEKPAAKREVVLMAHEGPVAVGEIPAVMGALVSCSSSCSRI